jgi:hypothetical protein
MARLCRVRALNARTYVREQVRSRGSLGRGGARSREVGTLERGGTCSSGREPSSEAEPARGGALLGHFGGPWGPPQRGPCRVCVLRLEVCFVLFFAGFKQDSPGFLGDPQGCPRH